MGLGVWTVPLVPGPKSRQPLFSVLGAKARWISPDCLGINPLWSSMLGGLRKQRHCLSWMVSEYLCMACPDADEEKTKKTVFIGGRRQPKPMEVERANAGARDPSAK